ncbi:hypothetical protein [Comamonas sp. NoAH]|uniref:hypothetical protein n=1 Tax=Comamonas halotolerans TaxID=3041496 RepID=UPI0024E07F0E|nr:hypothetical protein [Comamonas sp. NoAH]
MGPRHKRPADPKGGHVRIYWELIDSMAWRSLSYASQSLFLLMRRRLLGTNNGNISATLGDLKHYGWTSSSTLAKALKELQTLGFIAVTRQGGIAYGQKMCTLYRFTDVDVYEHPKLGIGPIAATNDWKKFSTLAQVMDAMKPET